MNGTYLKKGVGGILVNLVVIFNFRFQTSQTYMT